MLVFSLMREGREKEREGGREKEKENVTADEFGSREGR